MIPSHRMIEALKHLSRHGFQSNGDDCWEKGKARALIYLANWSFYDPENNHTGGRWDHEGYETFLKLVLRFARWTSEQ